MMRRSAFEIECRILSWRGIRAWNQPGLQSDELREGELLSAGVGAEI